MKNAQRIKAGNGYKNRRRSRTSPKNRQRITRPARFSHAVVFTAPDKTLVKEGNYSETEARIQCMLLNLTLGKRNGVKYEVMPNPVCSSRRIPLTQSQLKELIHV